ncbi:MAG: hypothetical protein M1379_01435 [Firmicutes bacterium]|nr:hypothetical protein [Bacillota bacterium]
MLLGSVFWAEIGDRFLPEDADLKDYFRRALGFRKQLAPYFAAGTFVDDEGIWAMDDQGIHPVATGGDQVVAASRAAGFRDLAATHWILPRGAGRTHQVVAANRGRSKERKIPNGREPLPKILLKVDSARVLAVRSIQLDGEWRDARFEAFRGDSGLDSGRGSEFDSEGIPAGIILKVPEADFGAFLVEEE